MSDALNLIKTKFRAGKLNAQADHLKKVSKA